MKSDWRPLFMEARRAERPDDLPAFRDFAYYAAPLDRRGDRRRRTRLRSGKLLDADNAFLADCQIFDRSEGGARIRLFDAFAPASSLRLYEDRPEGLFDARLVWRNGRQIGLVLTRPKAGARISALDLLALRERRYAVKDRNS